ncbi:conserved hypothetical protein [Altererythrobacter sp. B11]|nr:conserved hypothetical protein [Altererythrobacter sp. B11]
MSVDDALLQQSSTASLEANLNKLPQFTPDKTPTQGGDIQPTARNTPGSATISLRGIGANRSLVLLDGRRATPSNASMVVDINTIPSAAIERVEIVSGGASSTYGADAVSGVVNFILKKDFVGLELDGQAGITQEGDNFEYRFGGIMGADFDDGRGNISIAMSMNKREAALQTDRRWYRDIGADPSIGGSQLFPPYGGFNTGFSNLPNPNVLNSVIDGATFTAAPVNTSVFADFQGNAFTGFDTGGVPGVAGFERNIDNYEYKLLDNGQIGVNDIDAYLIFPLTRYNMYALGNYEINDWLSVFAQSYFSSVETTTQQQPGVIQGGFSASIDPTINRDVLPAELLAILDSRPRPDAPFTFRGYLPFSRTSHTDVFTYNMTAGLQGKIPGTDWTFELFGSQGETHTSVLQTGFASLERFRTIITQPNLGRGFDQTGNASNGGFGASTGTCTSGLNLFNPASISGDCLEAIAADIKTTSTMQQTIWEGDFQGGLFELPAGQLRAAIGMSYRSNDYDFQNDTISTQGRSFLDQVIGLQPSGNSDGRIEAREIYGEMLVPLLADIPAIQLFDLELGLRYSDYNTTGGSWTYKALANWEVNDWLRFRGGFNRAERAPNIAELYLAPEQGFTSAAGGDLCSINNDLAYSANPNRNSNYAQAIGLCGALMEASGDGTADDQFYGVDYRTLVSAGSAAEVRSLVTTAQAAGAAFVFPRLVGNPNLKPEKADTWTAGFVLSSPFNSSALSGLRLAVDYYNIKVTDAIGAQTVDIVQRQCFDPAFNPDYDPSAALCSGVDRNQAGALGNILQTFYNNGRFRTSGVDVQLDWSADIGPGRMSLNSVFNYLIEMKAAELPTDAMLDYAGSQGPNSNGLNGNSYRYKVLTTVGYSLGGAYLGLQWRHLPSIRSQTSVTVPTTSVQGVTSSYDLFNLQGSYALSDTINLRFGVDNLFNKAPPLSGRNPDAALPSLPGGSFDVQNYDVNGRRFYLGARVKF